MTWTSNKPTKPGWYWWRKGRLCGVREVKYWFTFNSHGLYMTGRGYVQHLDGEWAGPLNPPKEG
jgi:hypothetical protein